MKWVFFGVILFISANIYGQVPMASPHIHAQSPFSFTVTGTITENGTNSLLQNYAIETNGRYFVPDTYGVFKVAGTIRDTLNIVYKGKTTIRIPLADHPYLINEGGFNIRLSYNSPQTAGIVGTMPPSVPMHAPPPRPAPQTQNASAESKISADDDKVASAPVTGAKKKKNNEGKADDGQTAGQGTSVKSKTRHVATFPFPPPKGYTDHVLDRSLFAKCKTLGDVNEIILKAIGHCQYDDKSYYPIPGGFALITKIEEIKSDGTSVSGDDRFSLNKNDNMTLWDWISPRKGYFRFFAFLVTDQDFQATDEELNEEKANDLLVSGYNVLPDEIADKGYTPAYDCTVVVYEFEAPDVNSKLQSIIPARLTAVMHLNKSRISKFLTEEP